MSDLALVISGVVSAFGIGWSVGKGIKMLRQFFDAL